MTYIRVLVLGLAMLVALAGCAAIPTPAVQEDAPADTTTEDAAADVIRIGAAVSETGKYSREGRTRVRATEPGSSG